MTTRVLVTGSLGYIGSRLTQELEQHGFRCVGYDVGFFRDCLLYDVEEPETILKDLRDLDADDLQQIDAVVHLAGVSNDPLGALPPAPIYGPVHDYTMHLAGLCKAMGIRLIFASSCSVYGDDRGEMVTEASATFPQTPYAASKLEIEQSLRAMSDKTFCPIILRLATVFGLSPRMRFDVVVNMLVGMAVTMRHMLLNSDGRAWRPLVHIDDVCKAIRYCLDPALQPDGAVVLNVGDQQQNFQILELAHMVQAEVPGCGLSFLSTAGSNSIWREDVELFRDRKIKEAVDTRTYRVSFERIRAVLPGFQCDWTVPDGIRVLVSQLRQLGLTAEQLKHPNFYRLQRLEQLLNAGHLTADGRWHKRESEGDVEA